MRMIIYIQHTWGWWFATHIYIVLTCAFMWHECNACLIWQAWDSLCKACQVKDWLNQLEPIWFNTYLAGQGCTSLLGKQLLAQTISDPASLYWLAWAKVVSTSIIYQLGSKHLWVKSFWTKLGSRWREKKLWPCKFVQAWWVKDLLNQIVSRCMLVPTDYS